MKLDRFPNSKFVHIAREKLPGEYRKRTIVLSSLENLDLNDWLLNKVRNESQTDVFSGVINHQDIVSIDRHVKESDNILIIMDDDYLPEIFALFALCVKYRREVLVFCGDENNKVTSERLNKALIKAQTETASEPFQKIVRHVRLNADGYIKKAINFKSITTETIDDQLRML